MNISKIHNCYGCGVCATICPHHIISMELNKDGFYEPKIKDIEQCTQCGLCLSVCSFCNEGLSLQPDCLHGFAAWSMDNEIRHKCSSGGIGFELGRSLLRKGYKVCAVRYNPRTKRSEHYIATQEEELLPAIGSKYIQSYTLDGFKAINRREKYLVTGTPCQIDSFRRYIRKCKVEDNFVLIDFFCHGVPSAWLWKKYIHEVQQVTGDITFVSWRDKNASWHDSYAISVRGKDKDYKSKFSQGDIFYRLFLGDSCLGKACYDNCKFKYLYSSADIRIGDLWGKVYGNNEDGVSAVITFTEKGLETVKYCNCKLIEHTLDVVTEGQMKKSAERSAAYEMLRLQLNDPAISITNVYANYQKELSRIKWVRRLKNPFHSGLNLLIRLGLWK